MFTMAIEQKRDLLILIARIFLMIVFLLSGWPKLMNFSATVHYMSSLGTPLPTLAAAIAVAIEVFGGIALVLGVWTRPIALIYVFYTFGTALIGHHYWTFEGAERLANFINFYKNISIMGGLLLLAVTGPGKYSVDRS
jgi:putative oxidoreductase